MVRAKRSNACRLRSAVYSEPELRSGGPESLDDLSCVGDAVLKLPRQRLALKRPGGKVALSCRLATRRRLSSETRRAQASAAASLQAMPTSAALA